MKLTRKSYLARPSICPSSYRRMVTQHHHKATRFNPPSHSHPTKLSNQSPKHEQPGNELRIDTLFKKMQKELPN
ncbi:hypothetical protein L1987_59062 [Smallanthus sonchifolius]|uniref:Uncharacterized protein n=1 Tax=Smallanthus sonchifolius TaxID=185202 RepID=A0ACB9D4E6_9ASTR|nr:hypothetical protein L1987_59062 [Smallanthus sonchifolius]